MTFVPIIAFVVTMGLATIGSTEFSLATSNNEPIIKDNDIVAELVYNGTTINSISNMAILDSNDILILDRTEGQVRRIVNGSILPIPLLDVNVSDPDGLLGIAVSNESDITYVYLYYTQAPVGYDKDIRYHDKEQKQSVNSTFGYIRECNCLYRYELIDDKLVNPALILKLPARPGGDLHHGGDIVIGPDNNLYVIIGDLEGDEKLYTRAQNYLNGTDPDGRAGILRVTLDGEQVGSGILGNDYPLSLYYAYGIRNSFGLAFDPITHNLWDTENGPEYGDEINLVEPGFNSGSDYVFGMSSSKGKFDPGKLENFGGKGKYSDPELSWVFPVAPTAIQFLNSDKLGKEYENDMFVADALSGYIYHFDLNENRTELLLEGPLQDKEVNNIAERDSLVFAKFGNGVTDLQVGPDGYLYVLASEGRNTLIYRLLAKTNLVDAMGMESLTKGGENSSLHLAGERSLVSVHTSLIGGVWINDDPDKQTVFVNMRDNRSISEDDNAVEVNIKRDNATTWNKISTYYMPINGYTPYNYNLNVSAQDVNQLHSKVYYYDSNMTEIKWDFIFHGTEGTFKDVFTETLISPSDAAYIKLQMWVHPNPEKDSSYLINNADAYGFQLIKECYLDSLYQDIRC